jgi:hypothetical protein
MKHDYQNVLKENIVRNKAMFCEYNPLTGVGSQCERFKFKITNDSCIHLPILMLRDNLVISDIVSSELSVEDYLIRLYGLGYSSNLLSEFVEGLMQERIKYDFEYWAFLCARIKEKDTGDQIPFKLNRAQRKLVSRFMYAINHGKPIRIILCKARQWGGSTATQLFFLWIQLFVKTGWSSCIVGAVKKQPRIIRAMIKNVAKNHPKQAYNLVFDKFEGSEDLVIKGTTTTISVGSMQAPDNLRADNVYLAHLSEVGIWKKTDGKTPEDVIQSVSGSVANIPYTAIVIESTAKGVGNYFYNQYIASKTGKSDYENIFIPWWYIDIYSKDIDDYVKFMDEMTEYDWWQWEIGATLESINWYHHKKRSDFSGSLELEWRIFEEFPSDDEEAFQSSGSRVFPKPFVSKFEKMCKDPIFIGDIHGDGDRDKAALKGIEIYPNSKGFLKIWVYPEEDTYSNRYVVVVDIGGKSKTADNSVITVFDNLFTHENGRPEMCATWVGHIDHDILAWKAVQISKYYNNALLVIENNSLKKESVEGSEGYHFETVLNTIVDHYSNIYCTQKNLQKIIEGAPVVYGFNTNGSTKPTIIDYLYTILRDGRYIEYDLDVCVEYDQYERKPDGTFGAKDKCHDDRLMTRAIGLWVCYEDSPRPVLKARNANIKKKSGGVSTF